MGGISWLWRYPSPPPRGERNPIPTLRPPAQSTSAKKNTYISGSEKSMMIPSVKVRQKVAGNPGVLLKGHLLAGTHPGLQWRDSGSGSARDIQEETELCNFRARNGGDSHHFPCVDGLPVQLGTILPMLSPLPTRPNLSLHWPGELCVLHPGDSLGLYPTQSHSTRLLLYQQPALPCAPQEALSAANSYNQLGPPPEALL